MAGRGRDVTEAELAVLQVLWGQSPVTIQEITGVVHPEDVRTQYSTVKRLLARLETKGYVQRDRNEAVHEFEAVVGRDELVGRRLDALADSLCDGSISPLLTCLAKSETLTEEQQAVLLSLICEVAEPTEDSIETEKKPQRILPVLISSDPRTRNWDATQRSES